MDSPVTSTNSAASPRRCVARAEARLAMAIESGYSTGRALSEIYLGWADAMAGDHEGGIARMRHHLAELKATGSEYISDRCLAFIAIALVRMKRFDEGLRTLRRGLLVCRADRAAILRRGVTSIEGRIVTRPDRLECRGGGAVLSHRDRNFAQAACEVVGTARDHQPCTTHGETAQTRRGAQDARGNLRVVHRRLRYQPILKDAKDLLTKLKA